MVPPPSLFFPLPVLRSRKIGKFRDVTSGESTINSCSFIAGQEKVMAIVSDERLGKDECLATRGPLRLRAWEGPLAGWLS